MTDEPGGSATIGTLEKGFRIIETIEELESATLTDVADEMGLARSTVHDYLTTLCDLEYLVKTDGEYQLGLTFTRLGTSATETVQLSDTITPYLERLADATGETVWFLVEECGRAVYLGHAEGDQAIKTEHTIGGRSYLHCHAGGKAILAQLPDERVEEIIDMHGLPEITEHTITSREALFEELERIRDRNYAQNHSEQLAETRAVSAAIVVDDEVLGAISVGGPAHRLRGDRFETELPNQVMSVVNEIRINHRYS
ncbi:IclR family transcriptional regulator [Halopenitus sp. POP-27]|uniref:IclR family transcriptional regulator n=1 Tax=Halopenitus sp. POP-27 TaxID=2994425 RepID=UPI0024688A96|nr:IclR family transcriptional regulator [Halopenitus sp. POP-27]